MGQGEYIMNRPQDFAALTSSEAFFVEELYQKFKGNPSEVTQDWKTFFQGFDFAVLKGLNIEGDEAISNGASLEKELKIAKLIYSYRSRAHLISNTNPIRTRKDRGAALSLEDHGLKNTDLQYKSYCGVELGLGIVSLGEILQHLENIYCKTLGFEFTHIADQSAREWFKEKIESTKGIISLSIKQKKRILQKLNEASVFENFLDTKYVGQKRFSLEGGENAISALDTIIGAATNFGVQEVVLGMAHRGRLNVLATILGKTYDYIFSEFEGATPQDLSFGDGDVKYHLGYSSEVITLDDQKVYVKLMPNPSHLEAVGPVVMGYCRAQAEQLYDEDRSKILPIVLHGDAAVAGQGIVYEALQFSQLPGYKIGGTIHFVINNQIGFTTDFGDARSSIYSTSVARTLDIPVIHVNGDDAEAVVYAAQLAVEFRQKFGRDIFVDMVCYRKHGHNESDEPRFTQPKLYELIKDHSCPREIYTKQLIERKSIDAEIARSMELDFKKLLQDRFNFVKQTPLPYVFQRPEKEWENLRSAKEAEFYSSPSTAVKAETLQRIYKALVDIPSSFSPIIKANRILDDRKNKWKNNTLDWSMCELLAYGTLLHDGHSIRITGQDCIRGTFSHRHAEFFDVSGEKVHNNLKTLNDFPGKFKIYNSLLSEYAVLSYEYGYSLSSPKSLVIWEAQFGDFSNGAQVVFDQFISSGESKWQKMSGLVCYLPHGYEGQGPEHSSARVERFLQLCAESNMVVANPTTPANFFHLLRRQMRWNFRKPLIVLTPKSLLRHPQCVSTKEELEGQNFKELIIHAPSSAPSIKKVLWCSGKIAYDLLSYQKSLNITDTAVVCVEQLFPMPLPQVQKILKDFSHASMVWVQEEPKNMGPWSYLMRYVEFKNFNLISRKYSASPATGYSKIHAQEQSSIVKSAFEI
jgi:2-oxoglutarate dehydrogenase E1 component